MASVENIFSERKGNLESDLFMVLMLKTFLVFQDVHCLFRSIRREILFSFHLLMVCFIQLMNLHRKF